MDKWNEGRISAVIFDFDGVILESAGIKTQAFADLFSSWPHHVASITQYHLEHQGISRFVKFRWIYKELLKQPLSTEQELELGTQYSNLVFEKIKCAPFVPGAIELLNFLKARSIPTFIASGTPDAELQAIVMHRELDTMFRSVHGTPMSKETIIGNVLNDLGVSTGETLFIGDAITDYNAAMACNVGFLARWTPEMDDFWKSRGVTATPDLAQVISRYVW